MSASKPTSGSDAMDLARGWRDWRGDPEVTRPEAVMPEHLIALLEQLEQRTQNVIDCNERSRALVEKVIGLEEQLEAMQTAMRRARHELDQWVFADGTASYRVERAEEILDAALGASSPASRQDA